MHPIEETLPFDGVHLVDRPWFPYLCTEVDNWEWETRGDAHYNFWVVLAGEGTLSTEGRTFRLKPGMFFIFSPNQQITAAHTFGERVTRFSAHFQPLSGAVLLDPAPQLSRLGGQVLSLNTFKRQIDAIMRLAFRREDEARLHRQMYRLIAQTLSGSEMGEVLSLNERVSQAIEWMRADPARIDSMESLAARLHCSRSHFDREFSRQVGQAPKQFLLNCKMVEARRSLESGSLRVGEIAEQLGYRDIYFFSRQFKAFFGMSPMQYRQSVKGV